MPLPKNHRPKRSVEIREEGPLASDGLWTEQVDGIAVVRVAPDQWSYPRTAHCAPRLMEFAQRSIPWALDLSNLEYLDWFAFELILEVLRGSSAPVALVSASPRVAEWLTLSGLDGQIALFSSLSQALEHARIGS